jgi:hypothetical protein
VDSPLLPTSSELVVLVVSVAVIFAIGFVLVYLLRRRN